MDKSININEYAESEEKSIRDKIGMIISKNSQVIAGIKKVGLYTNTDSNIPNIGITYNNKINEISKEFKRHGISMFVQEKNGFPFPNYVGSAIIDDIISRISVGIDALSEYNSTMGNSIKQKNKQIDGPFKRLFFKVKSMLNTSKISELTTYSEEDTKKANSHLSKYTQMNEAVYGYNLRDNIISSLERKIISQREFNKRIGVSDKDIVEQEIAPTLKALGLESLIPQLRERLGIQEKESDSRKSWDLENWGIAPEEFREETHEIISKNNNNENSVEIPASQKEDR